MRLGGLIRAFWFYLAHLCFRWGYALANRAKDGVGEADEFKVGGTD
jgi:hypothetical protein